MDGNKLIPKGAMGRFYRGTKNQYAVSKSVRTVMSNSSTEIIIKLIKDAKKSHAGNTKRITSNDIPVLLDGVQLLNSKNRKKRKTNKKEGEETEEKNED